MPLAEFVKPSLRQFRTQPLQSLLIVVAVALGVGVVTAVAALLDIGRQSQAQFDEELIARELTLQAVENDTSAFTSPGLTPVDVRQIGLVSDEPVTFTLEDLEAARNAAPSIDYAYLNAFKTFHNGALGEDFLVGSAVTADYIEAAGLEVTSGSLPTDSDFAENRRVMLVTPRVVERLQLTGDPIGQAVAFEREDEPYTIIGLLPDSEERFSVREIVVPYVQESGPFSSIRELKFAVEDADDLAQASAELEAFSRERWGERVSVSSRRANRQAFIERQRTRRFVIAIFASIALVVAALNIMTLMLARVLRRRREIGIQRSLGATRRQIRGRFLGEAFTLGLLGGILGMAAGYGFLSAYNSYLHAARDGFAVKVSFSFTAVIIGLALALLTSLLFGLYPAILASRLRIVEALREF